MVKLYVEGGGNTSALRTGCRKAFSTFLTNAGLSNRPRVVACGSRRDAYQSFCTAVRQGEDAVLLVDSEAPVAEIHARGEPHEWQPWAHLHDREGDEWRKPATSREVDCHLMVQCMETWLISDRNSMKAFFGQGFREEELPQAGTDLERLDKSEIHRRIKKATDGCKTKGAYGKGEHSFTLLLRANPANIVAASRWAFRFVDGMKAKMGGQKRA